MTTVISMLRGINVGGHNRIKMEDLRALYGSLALKNPQTYVQSGNVVFRTKETNLARLAERIETAIDKKFGFRPDVVLRTASEIKAASSKSPFARRQGINPGKLAVVFFKEAPATEDCDDVLRLKATVEEVHADRREWHIYFGDGMGRSKLFAAICKKLKSGTARNWNTVTKLLEMAEKLESSR
jgi:uncharacterized protein (DUF1697 family)